MKKIAVITFSLFFISIITAFNPSQKRIVGYWKIEKMVFPKPTPHKKDIYLHFQKNNQLTSGSLKRKGNKLQGDWTLNKKTKTITINSNPQRSDNGEYKILSIDQRSMILEKDSIKLHLRKISSNDILQSQ